jgi:hypothetical protein
MKPSDCPRFHACNAPVCPLDAAWPRTVHLSGEAVCYYLLATGKAGAAERFADDPVFAGARELAAPIGERFPRIQRDVAYAARFGLRGDHLRRLRRSESGAVPTTCGEGNASGTAPASSEAGNPQSAHPEGGGNQAA